MKNINNNDINNDAFKESKNSYNQIPIPNTYSQKVREAINMSNKRKTISKPHVILYSIAGAAAAVMLMFTVIVNTNTAFAATLSNVPILKDIVTVITGIDYSKTNDNVNVDVKTPQITVNPSVSGEQSAVTAAKVNKQINAAVNEYIARQEKEAEEYKQAFLATGGTIEEWNERGIDIKADYEIKYQDNKYLSLYIYMYMSAFAFSQENEYYNYDFSTGRELTLKDILGDNYIEIANKSIVSQIEKQIADDPNNIYFGYNSGDGMDTAKFTTITDETDFYLNAEGKPVVCFEKYEIAPGYMGVCEFVIEK